MFDGGKEFSPGLLDKLVNCPVREFGVEVDSFVVAEELPCFLGLQFRPTYTSACPVEIIEGEGCCSSFVDAAELVSLEESHLHYAEFACYVDVDVLLGVQEVHLVLDFIHTLVHSFDSEFVG